MHIRTRTNRPFDEHEDIEALRAVCNEWHDGPTCPLGILWRDYLDDDGTKPIDRVAVQPRHVLKALETILADKDSAIVARWRVRLDRVRSYVYRLNEEDEMRRFLGKAARRAQRAGLDLREARDLFRDAVTAAYADR